ncbi:MAG TPA: FAD-dependent oxidoreductase [Microlunatus sp.]
MSMEDIPREPHPRENQTFDVVVVGSGFGGSVAAYRLAEAGLSVCLLERGRRYPPGTFARSAAEASRTLWDPSEGLHGLYDLWSFRHTDAIVSSGLGGGSLIYANVLLRMDPQWFYSQVPGEDPRPWPVSRDQLEQHYAAVEGMLTPKRYPTAYASITPKPRQFAAAAADMGETAVSPPLAITFAEDPLRPTVFDDGSDNIHGVPRIECRRSGQCDVGCNNGSKNTLDLTYLSKINNENASIYSDCEVKSFAREDQLWQIGYVHHDPPDVQRVREDKPTPRTIRARALVLAAGTFGTNFLLMKNRASLPELSDRIGQGFSGNGDFLGFLTRGSGPVAPANGPVITSTIRRPDWADDGNGTRPADAPLGHYVQDGGYPGLLEWFTELAPPTGIVRRGASLAVARLRQKLTGAPPINVSKKIAVLLNEGRQSANIMPLLAMGRDAPDTTLKLKRGFLDLEQGPGSAEYVRQVRITLKGLAAALGANYHDYMSTAFSRFITVHPLGGAAMAASPDLGVVDEFGRVFGYEHDHLLVMDGSIMPGPVGPNPSLTIAALADRCTDQLIADLSSPAGHD